jgi:tRNA dimethylallyltransferase
LAGKSLIVILGPTAVGKTGLAIEMARALNGEVVSADSRQVYRHMDIGTDKPTPEECAKARHHLIDIIDPDYNLTVAEYQDRAYQVIDDIHRRDKIPLLVGGTGQYITAVTEGWSIPRVPPNETLRAQLEAYAQQYGAEAFHRRLMSVDPEAAANIHPNNVRRVVRALEVYLETGTPISILQRKKPPLYRILTYGLTMEREALYERADKRVDRMVEAGFVEEVRRLLEMGYDRKLPSMTGLGYLEMVAHLLGEMTLEEAITRTKFATHNFIRRQYVWFRGHDNGIIWHNADNLEIEALIQKSAHWLQQD